MIRVLSVDDHPVVREGIAALKELLETIRAVNAGQKCLSSETATEIAEQVAMSGIPNRALLPVTQSRFQCGPKRERAL